MYIYTLFQYTSDFILILYTSFRVHNQIAQKGQTAETDGPRDQLGLLGMVEWWQLGQGLFSGRGSTDVYSAWIKLFTDM